MEMHTYRNITTEDQNLNGILIPAGGKITTSDVIVNDNFEEVTLDEETDKDPEEVEADREEFLSTLED